MLILIVSNFEISDNSFNDEHSENIPAILVTLNVFHFEISGNSFNEEQKENKKSIF